MKKVSLIGVPTDVGGSRRGASMGPAALRVAGLVKALSRFDCVVKDCGDIGGPPNPEGAIIDGYRNLFEVTAWAKALYEKCLAELRASALPLVMGGDHSMAIGSLAAVAQHCRETKQNLRVLWLDAHADFNTAQSTPSGNIHGMPLACLFGHGPPELVNFGANPSLKVSELRQIGVRSVDEGEKQLLYKTGYPVYDMRYIDENGIRSTLEAALAKLPENSHLHVNIDVDILDPHLAPGAGTIVPGGLSYREAQLCMEMIADTGACSSVDIVELNPALDHQNATAELVVDLIESLFGKTTLLRQKV